MGDKRVQIINFRGMDLEEVERNLRPLVTSETAPGIKVQVINIEDLDIDELGQSMRLLVACCTVAARTPSKLVDGTARRADGSED
jgi:hypothetical protein